MGVRLTNEKCPVCGEGKLMDIIEGREDLPGLDVHYSICDNCGSEICDAKQSRTNKENMIKWKAQNT